jgi:UDPglucose 6-dehydrogenase
MAKIFPEADLCDPAQKLCPEPGLIYDVAFVCVPTDPLPDGSCDTSIVERAIRENHARAFCVKSTVPPGTTERIATETGKRCVFSPEFFGGTQHANAVDYDFVILGGPREHTRIVAEAYKERMAGGFHIAQTDARTAELCKYSENAFLATKVVFVNTLYRMARAIGVDYNELRELLLLDPRIGRSHTFVYEDHPFYQSHCLDKDLPAAVAFSKRAGYDPELLDAVIAINDGWRNAK